MISQEFIVQCILQQTEQSALEWFINNEDGGYYAIVDGWSIRITGNNKFFHLTYQKGPKLGHIVAGAQRFISNDNPELKMILQLLLKVVRGQVFKSDGETVKVFERQEEKIRKEFCGSMLGWSK